jgi:hypothetical protein
MLVLASSPTAYAAIPPFALARAAIAKQRADTRKVKLDMRVTHTGGSLHEWTLRGTFAYDSRPGSFDQAPDPVAAQMLWIATLAADPVSQIQTERRFVDESKATVGLQDDFVYVYGSAPAVSVFRDMRRLAGFTVSHDGHRWVTRLAWRDDSLAGVMVTRDGVTVLTATSTLPVPLRDPEQRR